MKNIEEYKSIKELVEDINKTPYGVYIFNEKLNDQSKPKGVFDIVSERIRQITDEQYTSEIDDTCVDEELLIAAWCYMIYPATDRDRDISRDDIRLRKFQSCDKWPWYIESFKPKSKRENLVRAGALIAAEIDRMDREYERKENEKCHQENTTRK